jgi:pimeloyl-ACP methyl ester carboxylesterase
MGLSAQMLLWPDEFCKALVEKGFRVIRFDNRDIGLSTKIKKKVPPMNEFLRMARFSIGLKSPTPYTLFDMAGDVIGLMDFLKIDKAHIVGASMGGMIAQLVAAQYPHRTQSLAVIFSSTNQPLLPPPHPKALAPLMRGPSKGASTDQLVAHSMKLMRIIGSPAYPQPDDELRAFAEKLYHRSYHPAGVKRQFTAILSSGSLRPYSSKIRVPTIVIHGNKDRLMRPSCGKAVAKAIPDAHFHLIHGMGHDLPRALWPKLTSLIADNTRKVR